MLGRDVAEASLLPQNSHILREACQTTRVVSRSEVDAAT
jgi:hypothetical protein